MDKVVIGIDLGTTFSGAAMLDESGKPIMIPNSNGKNITPSVVMIDGDKVVVGAAAKNNMFVRPDNVVDEVKRFIGSDKTYQIDGKEHTPTSISSLILNKIKTDVEKYCSAQIASAVITVPANFGNNQREATMKAAQMSGLNVEFIINEPTAAALTYAKLKGGTDSGHYIIYDFGGGTFDCTIAEINADEVEVKTSEGVQKLGGKDLDAELLNLVKKKYKDLSGDDLEDTKFDLNDAERYKIDLSSLDEVTIFIDDVSIDILRSEFEEAITPLVDQSLMAMESALDTLGLEFSSIEDVILVGGSSRVPFIQESITKLTSASPVLFGNPDESVALGAAIYASKKNPQFLNINQKAAVDSFAIGDVCTKNYGTFAVDSSSGSDKTLNSIIIRKDTRIPCSISKTYTTMYDHQEVIDCSITECVNAETDPDFVDIVGKESMDLPVNCMKGETVTVTYSYNANQTMDCEFVHQKSGTKVSRQISMSSDKKDIPTEDIPKEDIPKDE